MWTLVIPLLATTSSATLRHLFGSAATYYATHVGGPLIGDRDLSLPFPKAGQEWLLPVVYGSGQDETAAQSEAERLRQAFQIERLDVTVELRYEAAV